MTWAAVTEAAVVCALVVAVTEVVSALALAVIGRMNELVSALALAVTGIMNLPRAAIGSRACTELRTVLVSVWSMM